MVFLRPNDGAVRGVAQQRRGDGGRVRLRGLRARATPRALQYALHLAVINLRLELVDKALSLSQHFMPWMGNF